MRRLLDFLFRPPKSTPQVNRRFRLADNADLTPKQIEQLESHVRWVARYLGSPAWNATVHDILVDNSVHKDVIGLCWSEDDHQGRPRSRRIWIDARLAHWDEIETLIHELSHAFWPHGESHGANFRRLYIIAWALYLKAPDRVVKREIKSHLGRYQPGGWRERRQEAESLMTAVQAARQQVQQEEEQRSQQAS